VQVLDGVCSGLFSVLAGTWVIDRLGDARRVSEAQAIVGTSLVLGSALGPAVSAPLVTVLGYRGLFGTLAVVGGVATLMLMAFVPETLCRSTDANGTHVLTDVNVLTAANDD
jgi:MFS family permease